MRLIVFVQILQREGIWSEVPETSQLLQDVKYRLIFIYQYHKDFYHCEEEFLEVTTSQDLYNSKFEILEKDEVL